MASDTEITKEKIIVDPLSHAHTNVMSLIGGSGAEYNKGRRRSTIHSYTLSNYHTLPHDPATMKAVRDMSETKALKNVIVLGFAFMFIFTAFISLQGLQSTMNWEGGVGVVSLSSMYLTTILSCIVAPFIIKKLTTKWTMVMSFIFFTGYFAGNFHPEHYMLLPLGVVLGFLAGPMWSAQATSITTIALAYAEHSHIQDQDVVINKFMGIFCGLYRTSNIWGNLITTLVLSQNKTFSNTFQYYNTSTNFTCGSTYCLTEEGMEDQARYSADTITIIPESTRIMLLSIYLGCGVMGVVILISLMDQCNQNKDDSENLSSKELCLATLDMLRDSRCQLLALMVVFVGLEQGFMFGDFTKAYISCTLGVTSIGPVMICFGAVSAVSCVMIGYFASKHIKRFAFITAGATFNVGLLIVLWLWKPSPNDIPNFFVVAGCLGLCDAIWQTQTYTLYGVLFLDRQEAAFSSYRMFYATGCAVAFGYSHFLCVQTKVYVLGGVLVLALIMYCVIEMKVQLQSQHIKDIVAL
ncbi:protein unc-93 homolog A-like [Argopecten irradians]|uniref:protein unc-93 homolog A-like n=1 Tax=Argopecten irradians TaxID=31199 RepID=UPI003713186F